MLRYGGRSIYVYRLPIYTFVVCSFRSFPHVVRVPTSPVLTVYPRIYVYVASFLRVDLLPPLPDWIRCTPAHTISCTTRCPHPLRLPMPHSVYDVTFCLSHLRFTTRTITYTLPHHTRTPHLHTFLSRCARYAHSPHVVTVRSAFLSHVTHTLPGYTPAHTIPLLFFIRYCHGSCTFPSILPHAFASAWLPFTCVHTFPLHCTWCLGWIYVRSLPFTRTPHTLRLRFVGDLLFSRYGWDFTVSFLFWFATVPVRSFSPHTTYLPPAVCYGCRSRSFTACTLGWTTFS